MVEERKNYKILKKLTALDNILISCFLKATGTEEPICGCGRRA